MAGPSWAEDSAPPEEIVAKVKEAAEKLAAAGEAGLAEFNEKESPWVWKDTYVFVTNCDAGVMSAHPIKADLIGEEIMPIKDTKDTLFFADLCEASKQANGGWVEYWWPKPGEEEGSRKISYIMAVENTPYQVSAGVYDEGVDIAELEKINNP
jgi:signal transduction histidine kinase